MSSIFKEGPLALAEPVKIITRNGPRGPAGLGIPFAVDRMQNLVEILGQPFAEMLIWIPKFKNVA